MSVSVNVPSPAHTVAQLLRPGSAPRSVDVPAEAREHAATVVAHLLHRECAQWSWTAHHADLHRPEARRIVGALCRGGWAPHADPVETHDAAGVDGADGADGADAA